MPTAVTEFPDTFLPETTGADVEFEVKVGKLSL